MRERTRAHRFTFFLRILGKLVGDDDFTLPFWNVDNQTPLEPIPPNAVPPFYRDPDRYPGLYHSAREPKHRAGQPRLLGDFMDNYLSFPDHVTPCEALAS